MDLDLDLEADLGIDTVKSSRGAVDAVIVEERLDGGVKRSLDRHTAVEVHARDAAEHGALRRGGYIQAADRVPFLQERTQTAGRDHLTAGGARGQFAPDPRNAGFGRQHIDAASSIIFGIEPRVAIPMPPHVLPGVMGIEGFAEAALSNRARLASRGRRRRRVPGAVQVLSR